MENSGEGYHSCNWHFASRYAPDYERIFSLIRGAGVGRRQGIFISEQGVFGFNKADKVLTVLELDDTMKSRIEVIDWKKRDWDRMESSWIGALGDG
ncbi:hypothetical protein [uncultured Microbulbifer sp.]|uniref:hypothetical protein n=1 Tax=uncultured Microbulbifer sp. TaxID=348147 RepID=UPI002622E880|nr:hypothetical protein [uncultured Microbulbifer sp.]